MSEDLSLKEMQKTWHGSQKAYAIGFIVSLLLTAASFTIVGLKLLPPSIAIYVVSALAFCQAVIQLIYFLHLGQEDRPQWESLVFYFMILVLLIIVIGSLWVMYDLNARMMPHMNMHMN